MFTTDTELEGLQMAIEICVDDKERTLVTNVVKDLLWLRELEREGMAPSSREADGQAPH